MKFIDILYETLIREFRSPEQQFEIISLLLIDMALKAKSVSESKAFRMAAALVTKMKTTREFPSIKEIDLIRADVNRNLRGTLPCTASVAYSIEEIELSERAVKKFLTEHAWEGLPGFGSWEEKATTSKPKIKRKQPDLDRYWKSFSEKRVFTSDNNSEEDVNR